MPHRSNKFVMAGGLLCGFADLFAIVSLVTPNWVVNDFLGMLKYIKFNGIKLGRKNGSS
jgi:hypothetical protein